MCKTKVLYVSPIRSWLKMKPTLLAKLAQKHTHVTQKWLCLCLLLSQLLGQNWLCPTEWLHTNRSGEGAVTLHLFSNVSSVFRISAPYCMYMCSWPCYFLYYSVYILMLDDEGFSVVAVFSKDLLRCRVLTSGIFETRFQVDKVNFQ